MLGSRRLARSISDAGWSAFVSTLKHKAESAGVEVVEVDPKGTSQQCSGCGVMVPKDLWVRMHSRISRNPPRRTLHGVDGVAYRPLDETRMC
jgi:transposase